MTRQKKVYNPDYAVAPGETLKEVLESLNMSQSELATRMKRPIKTISDIINGNTAITPDTALQLAKVLGISASFWNRLENNYREKLAELKERDILQSKTEWLKNFPIKSMIERGWILKKNDVVDQIKEVLDFFSIASPDAWLDVWGNVSKDYMIDYRKSKRFSNTPEAVSVWIRRGEIEVANRELPPYDVKKFREMLALIRSLTMIDRDECKTELVKLCTEAGVALALVPEIGECRANGVARWIRSGSQPFILLSDRYKQTDHFWFTFFHEAGHILLHGKRGFFIEEEPMLTEDEKEKQADEFAMNILIPPDQYKTFVLNNKFSKEAVKHFAKDIGIDPGIVVGRLQHDKCIQYQHLNDLKRPFKIS